ncbi:hypothetical protein [Arthrobacter sp. D2-10]
MKAYLGPVGNLIGFRCPSSEEITLADNSSLSWTLGGKQKAQYGLNAPRAWQVGIGSATADQIAGLAALMRGLYGPPPWVYVGPWAKVTNLLTPAASVLQAGSWTGSAVPGGSVTLNDGTRPALSLLSDTGATTNLPEVPAIPGETVTGSAWGAGDSGFTVSLVFRSASGAELAITSRTTAASLAAPLVRGSVTAVAPDGATGVILRLSGAKRAAQPAVSWTPAVAAWTVGEGAPKVIAQGLSHAVRMAVRDTPSLRRTGASFTLQEVGNA